MARQRKLLRTYYSTPIRVYYGAKIRSVKPDRVKGMEIDVEFDQVSRARNMSVQETETTLAQVSWAGRRWSIVGLHRRGVAGGYQGGLSSGLQEKHCSCGKRKYGGDLDRKSVV